MELGELDYVKPTIAAVGDSENAVQERLALGLCRWGCTVLSSMVYQVCCLASARCELHVTIVGAQFGVVDHPCALVGDHVDDEAVDLGVVGAVDYLDVVFSVYASEHIGQEKL